MSQQYGQVYFFKNVKPLLSDADLTFANLECALSDRGTPVPGKKFTFRGSPGAVTGLKWSGIDVVSVANNHARDYGETAFIDTLQHLLTAGIGYAGGGRNADEAFSHRLFSIPGKGKKVAFLAFSDVLPAGWAATSSRPGVAPARDESRVLEAVKKARQEADLVVVAVHWGVEYDYQPTARQKRLAHLLVDAGADLVLGHHPHVVQPVEFYQGALIAYSLGNFVFSPGGSPGFYSGILKVSFCGRAISRVEVAPVVLTNEQPVPVALSSTWSARIDRLMQLNDFSWCEGSYVWENRVLTNRPLLRKFFTLEGLAG